MSSETIISKVTIKTKNELAEQVYQAIQEKGETGIFQTDLCKAFSMDSRDGSRLVGNLEKQSLIFREKKLYKGRWTYKLIVKKSQILSEEEKKPIDITDIEGAPCLRCSIQHLCSIEDESSQYNPTNCTLIEDWILDEEITKSEDENLK